MPRPRKSSGGPIKRRTRTGCQTCRQRRIKCDEARPVCSQCTAKGLECTTSTSLKWEAEYLSRGLSFGRAGVWSKTPQKIASPGNLIEPAVAIWCSLPEISSYSFVNATLDSIHELVLFDDTQPEQSQHAAIQAFSYKESDDSTTTSSLSPWLGTSSLVTPAMSNIITPPVLLPSLNGPDQASLLSYYLEAICPMTIPGLSLYSPFASLLVPFAITTSNLALDSILALAACHRSRKVEAFQATALKLSQRTMQTLRAKLRDCDSVTVALDPETLVVMLLLCLFEIVNECDKRWVVHLRGARDLVRVRRQYRPAALQDTEPDQLVRFCEQYFAFQDVMGRTACGEDPVFGSDFWLTDQTSCEPWLGCSPSLIAILSEITELSRQRQLQNRHQNQHFQAAAASLEIRLATLQQNAWDVADGLLFQAAELKRLAAELYLQCALNGASPSTPWVTAQILQILHLVDQLLNSEVISGISWPLFIAAVELNPLDDLEVSVASGVAPRYARAFVLYVLEKLSGSLVNVVRTRAVIEKVWQAREFHHLSTEDEPCPDNDWDHFVAPFCGNMSLA